MVVNHAQCPMPTHQNFWVKLLDTTIVKTVILLGSENAMGRSQVVRQRVLVPPSLGSNPSAPVDYKE